MIIFTKQTCVCFSASADRTVPIYWIKKDKFFLYYAVFISTLFTAVHTEDITEPMYTGYY